MDPNRSGWERLQALLERLEPGDEVEAQTVAQETGLEPETCAVVLEALTRADLFRRANGGPFVRRRLLDPMERLHM